MPGQPMLPNPAQGSGTAPGRVLLVEDDPEIGRVTKEMLVECGYSVEWVLHGREAQRAAVCWRPQIVLLDLLLDDMKGIGGLEVCEQLRRLSPSIWIIILTQMVDEDITIKALQVGADDYITKPFRPETAVLLVDRALRRVREVEQRSNALPVASDGFIVVGKIAVHVVNYEVVVAGVSKRLTPTQHKLLAYLAKNCGRVLTHGMLISHAWGEQYVGQSGREDLRVFIRQLREIIEVTPARPRYLITKANSGYQMVNPD